MFVTESWPLPRTTFFDWEVEAIRVEPAKACLIYYCESVMMRDGKINQRYEHIAPLGESREVRARRSIPHRASAASTGKEKTNRRKLLQVIRFLPTRRGPVQFLDKIHFRAEWTHTP